jgi:hypothetical protein
MSFSSTELVAKLTTEYLAPKYPIWKIDYLDLHTNDHWFLKMICDMIREGVITHFREVSDLWMKTAEDAEDIEKKKIRMYEVYNSENIPEYIKQGEIPKNNPKSLSMLLGEACHYCPAFLIKRAKESSTMFGNADLIKFKRKHTFIILNVTQVA